MLEIFVTAAGFSQGTCTSSLVKVLGKLSSSCDRSKWGTVNYLFIFTDKTHNKRNEIAVIMRPMALQCAIHAAGISLEWWFKHILNLKYPMLKQLMQMLEASQTLLSMRSSQPAEASLAALIDCSVLSRYQVTATLERMAQNAFPMVPMLSWGSQSLSVLNCWHPCSLAELRNGAFLEEQGGRHGICTLIFCCIALSPLPYIIQKNEPSYHQPVETQERRSLIDRRWKEQDFLLYFWVGWKDSLPKFALTSSLAQPFLPLQAKTIRTIAAGGDCLMLMGVLLQGYCLSTFRSLGSWHESPGKSISLTSRRRFLRDMLQQLQHTRIHSQVQVSDINWFHAVSLGCCPNTASCSNLLC